MSTTPTTHQRVRRPTGTPLTRALGIATLIGLAWFVAFGLFLSPDDVVQKKGVRILYLHVPSAWLAYLAFIVTAICSAAYLSKRTRSLTWDRLADSVTARAGSKLCGIFGRPYADLSELDEVDGVLLQGQTQVDESMLTDVELEVPLASPLQFAKTYPKFGLAVMATLVPLE